MVADSPVMLVTFGPWVMRRPVNWRRPFVVARMLSVASNISDKPKSVRVRFILFVSRFEKGK